MLPRNNPVASGRTWAHPFWSYVPGDSSFYMIGGSRSYH